MKTTHRRSVIVSQLAERGEVTIADLATALDVSEMTIRRDLELLEMEGIARRVRRGAISTVSRSHEPTFAMRATRALEAKRAIGRAAAALIQEGETAFVDVGTTTLELARHLAKLRRLTVVTSSIRVAAELGQSVEISVIVTGGTLRHDELSLVGPPAEDPFAELNCDVAFLGVAGVDARKGITEDNIDDTRIKRPALASARRCIVLADRSKIGRIAFASVAPLSAVDTLVTDAPPDHPTVVAGVEMGVRVVHVDSEPA
jgi:DeoR/GlpR family transcriptional regulator of sugar metabolism